MYIYFRHSFTSMAMVLITLCIFVATTSVYGFQPPRMGLDTTTTRTSTALGSVPSSSRKAFLTNTVTAVTILAGSTAMAVAPDTAHADEYDDARAAKRAKDAESNGGTALAIPLIGGLALSLPFFLPNILRLLGVKNSKMK